MRELATIVRSYTQAPTPQKIKKTWLFENTPPTGPKVFNSNAHVPYVCRPKRKTCSSQRGSDSLAKSERPILQNIGARTLRGQSVVPLHVPVSSDLLTVTCQ